MGDNGYDEKMYINHIPPIWKTHNIPNKTYYAKGCIFADNY
jgi:hypothetical protein